MTEIIIAVLLGVFVVATGVISLIRFNKDMKCQAEDSDSCCDCKGECDR